MMTSSAVAGRRLGARLMVPRAMGGLMRLTASVLVAAVGVFHTIPKKKKEEEISPCRNLG